MTAQRRVEAAVGREGPFQAPVPPAERKFVAASMVTEAWVETGSDYVPDLAWTVSHPLARIRHENLIITLAVE